jgi:hypothetical protein
MLVHSNEALAGDPLMLHMAKALPDLWDASVEEVGHGIYKFGTWPSSAFMKSWEHYPILSGDDSFFGSSYGVCDNPEQILAKFYSDLMDPAREFIIVLVEVKRADQEPQGGWRWHKWGEYIGTQNPQNEYLYDDTHIDSVLTYSIYEKKVPDETA